GVFVEQQVVVTEMRSTHVPMEVLGLYVECEHVREHAVQGRGDITHGVRPQVGGRFETLLASRLEIAHLRFRCCLHRMLLREPSTLSPPVGYSETAMRLSTLNPPGADQAARLASSRSAYDLTVPVNVTAWPSTLMPICLASSCALRFSAASMSAR